MAAIRAFGFRAIPADALKHNSAKLPVGHTEPT
jgi:hypothetical protein